MTLHTNKASTLQIKTQVQHQSTVITTINGTSESNDSFL